MKIGKIPYLNSVLFYHHLEANAGDEHTFHALVPRQLSGAAIEDGVDAGPVPIVTTWDIEDRFEPLGDFCISTKDKTRSIFFFSKKPFDELDGARVGVTSETSTSVRLLKVLLDHVYHVKPAKFERLDWPENDAFLLIGDEALLHRGGVRGYKYVADLGEVWNDWTGLPFVFARWVVGNNIDQAARESLIARIDDSIEYGWDHFDEVVAEKAKELSMSAQEVREYMEGFRFKMSEDDKAAVERFRKLDESVRQGETKIAGG